MRLDPARLDRDAIGGTDLLILVQPGRLSAEAVNQLAGLLRRGRGYKNLRYLLLKVQRMAATRTEFVVFKKAA